MNKKKWNSLQWVRVFFLVEIFVNPFSLSATTFIAKTETQMIKEATAICAVETLDLRSERVQSTVITKAKVRPIECFKGGNISKSFYVKWPGGSYNDNGKQYQAMVPGAPHLQKGKPVILYLWRSSPTDDYTILNWNSGVIRLERTPTNELVIPRSTNSSLDNKSKNAISAKKSEAAKSKGMAKVAKISGDSLSSFREKVQKVLSSTDSQ